MDGTGPPALEEEVAEALNRGGSRAATKVLVCRCGDAVYRYCRQLLRDRACADDVYQKIFGQVCRDVAGLRDLTSIRAWVFSIAYHRCMDEIKMNSRWLKRFTLCESPPDEPDFKPQGDEAVSSRELIAALNECLKHLDHQRRVAVILRYQEGFTYDAMARICGIPAATLRTQVSRAIGELRDCLESKGAI
jgi:RNA polymerase sigma factor (sigma-70 family)